MISSSVSSGSNNSNDLELAVVVSVTLVVK